MPAMRHLLTSFAVVAAAAATVVIGGPAAPGALAQGAASDPQSLHQHHQHPDAGEHPTDHSHSDSHGHGHGHDLGPAGRTYDLRWIDAMVQHHTGALRMSEFVFNVGAPGVGALAQQIWQEQAREIKAMGQWRRAWYPEAPVYPVVLPAGGDGDAISDLQPMAAGQIEAMRMMNGRPSRDNRIQWFLAGMIEHHSGAVRMAEDALVKSDNPTIRRLARQIIVTQQREILRLRRLLGG